MKKSFFKSPGCQNKTDCKECRLSQEFRKGLLEKYYTGGQDFKCPSGITEKDFTANAAQMLQTLTKAVIGDTWLRASGKEWKSSIPDKKLQICLSCPYVKKNNTCAICKCNVYQKVKRTRTNSPCPEGFWDLIEEYPYH